MASETYAVPTKYGFLHIALQKCILPCWSARKILFLIELRKATILNSLAIPTQSEHGTYIYTIPETCMSFDGNYTDHKHELLLPLTLILKSSKLEKDFMNCCHQHCAP